jgi:hypothetical protein
LICTTPQHVAHSSCCHAQRWRHQQLPPVSARPSTLPQVPAVCVVAAPRGGRGPPGRGGSHHAQQAHTRQANQGRQGQGEEAANSSSSSSTCLLPVGPNRPLLLSLCQPFANRQTASPRPTADR